jgi:AAA family ATP:ADP antiporter
MGITRVAWDGQEIWASVRSIKLFLNMTVIGADFVQVKGKAAIDVVCNPLGKSGGALIQQFLILGFGSLAASTPYLGAILLIIVLAWLGAARSLDAQFTPLVQKDLKGKLLEGKLSAISAAVLGQTKARKEVREFLPFEWLL